MCIYLYLYLYIYICIGIKIITQLFSAEVSTQHHFPWIQWGLFLGETSAAESVSDESLPLGTRIQHFRACWTSSLSSHIYIYLSATSNLK